MNCPSTLDDVLDLELTVSRHQTVLTGVRGALSHDIAHERVMWVVARKAIECGDSVGQRAGKGPASVSQPAPAGAP